MATRITIEHTHLEVDLRPNSTVDTLGSMVVDVMWSTTRQDALRYTTYAPGPISSPVDQRNKEKIVLPPRTLSIRHPEKVIKAGNVLEAVKLKNFLEVGWRAYVSALSIPSKPESIREEITDADRAMSDPLYARSRQRIASTIANYFEMLDHEDSAYVSGYRSGRYLTVRNIHYEMPKDEDDVEELRERIHRSYVESLERRD